MPDYQPFSTYPFAMLCTVFVGGLLYTFHSSRVSSSKVLIGTFVAQAAVMLLIPFAANIGGTPAYWSCFTLLFLYGLFSGVCQAACYDLNAKLPKSYIATFMTSHGVSGLASNALRLITMLFWSTNVAISDQHYTANLI